MNGSLRPLDPAHDLPALADFLRRLDPASPVSAATLAAERAALPAQSSLKVNDAGQLTGYGREEVLAVGPGGEVTGHGVAWRAPWTLPGDVCSTVQADTPELELALYRRLETWAEDQGAARLLTEWPDGNAATLNGLLSRGYRVDAHVVGAELTLADWHAAALQEAVAGGEAHGLRFATLHEQAGEETERQLHALCRETLADNPGFVGEVPAFGRWRAETLDPARTDWVFLALDGPQVVGVTVTWPQPDPQAAYTDYTGVRRAYRGRGIARALKLLAIGAAREAGVQRMLTEMEASNQPMQAVNGWLGYQPAGGHRRLIRALAQPGPTPA